MDENVHARTPPSAVAKLHKIRLIRKKKKKKKQSPKNVFTLEEKSAAGEAKRL